MARPRGALAGGVTVDVAALRSPLREARAEPLAKLVDHVIAGQRSLDHAIDVAGARGQVVGAPGAALVERDHVAEPAQRHEDRKPRARRGGDARGAWAAGQVHDRRAGAGRGRTKSHERQRDAPRARIGAALRYLEAAELGVDDRAVTRGEAIGLELERGCGRGGGRGGGEMRGRGRRCAAGSARDYNDGDESVRRGGIHG